MIAVVTTSMLIACGDQAPPEYERRDGPHVSSAERRGTLEYTHSLSANLCYPDDRGIARDAAREFRVFERLLQRNPEALIKTKVAYSDHGDIPRDVTLREYARETRSSLQENFEGLPRRARKCQLCYVSRLDRLLR